MTRNNYYFILELGGMKLAGNVNATSSEEIRKMFSELYSVSTIYIKQIDTEISLRLEDFISEITRLKDEEKKLNERKKEFEVYIEKLKETFKKSTDKLDTINNELYNNSGKIMVLEERLCKILK